MNKTNYNFREISRDYECNQSSIDRVIKIAQTLPLYRDNPAFKDIQTFELSKKNVSHNFPYNFMSDELQKAIQEKAVEYTATSGTTSDRMQIVRKKNWWKGEYLRTSRHNNFLSKHYSGEGKKAIFTTAICSNTVCHLHAPDYEERIMNGTLYLNSSHNPNAWTKENIEQIISEINQFQPTYIDADPLYLAIFFKKVEGYKLNLPDWKPEFLTLSYEFIPANCRSFIYSKWPIPTFSLYGATEAGYVACECEEGHFHFIESLSSYEFAPVVENKVYSLLVSTMKNEFMPLVHYRIGDLVSLRKDPIENCACGAEGRVYIEKLLGREKDAFKNMNGQLVTVGELDGLISSFPNVGIYQLDVKDLGHAVLNYTLLRDDEGLNETDQSVLKQSLISILHIAETVTLRRVDSILPESSGKFRLIVQA